ncbi:hypothetical protein F5Y05DRAFT_256909 [Hypoxylon sp. FL0543]|nr:hypothetical protein F5Y05DRAFT_256909 [Hypoxylon sp. FL0543]
MHWFNRDKTENELAERTRVWALVFDTDKNKDVDLHLPRYLYFAKQEPRKWNRVRWRDLVTGSCIVALGFRLYVITARPPSALDVSASDYAVSDPSGSCLTASTATIPTPLRTVYLGVVEHESTEHGCALIQLDAEYLPCKLAGERMTGTAIDIDFEWLSGQAALPQGNSDGLFWRQKVKGQREALEGEYAVEARGERLTRRLVRFKGEPSIPAQDRGAIVMSREDKTIGIALGVTEAKDDQIGQNMVLQILPFDELFWRDIVSHVSRIGHNGPVYEVWVDMRIDR